MMKLLLFKLLPTQKLIIEYSEKNNEEITSELINKIISDVIKEVNKELVSYKQIKKFYIRESEFEKTTTQKIKRYLVKKDGESHV